MYHAHPHESVLLIQKYRPVTPFEEKRAPSEESWGIRYAQGAKTCLLKLLLLFGSIRTCVQRYCDARQGTLAKTRLIDWLKSLEKSWKDLELMDRSCMEGREKESSVEKEVYRLIDSFFFLILKDCSNLYLRNRI